MIKKSYPIILHCTSGKDRTGFLSALIQLVAGVPIDTVLTEYMRSNACETARMICSYDEFVSGIKSTDSATFRGTTR
ncbi:tyrosine-protein phosphatase [Bacillus sp. NPDC093026]|uniref:tyrosine-protein phosphatase n=1 Tax=Bacillus sp. NPDC093026 TaxID=3363948 RepID=UPI0037FD93B0